MVSERRVASSKVGYLGVSIALLISFILGGLSLYQGARYFQGQSTDWLISSLIDRSAYLSYPAIEEALAQIWTQSKKGSKKDVAGLKETPSSVGGGSRKVVTGTTG